MSFTNESLALLICIDIFLIIVFSLCIDPLVFFSIEMLKYAVQNSDYICVTVSLVAPPTCPLTTKQLLV